MLMSHFSIVQHDYLQNQRHMFQQKCNAYDHVYEK